MKEKDPFTSFYDELLTDSYDSVDRIVLNGYCRQCCSPGGFRNWWRSLPNCGDDNLDDTHLMRMAGRFSRRLRGWLINFPFIVSQLKGVVDRFLKHLHCSDISLIDNNTLEELSQPAVLGKVRLGGLDLNKPRIQSVFKAIIQLSVRPSGFKVSDLAQRVDRMLSGITYTVRMAAYDLRKLRAKGLITKLKGSRIYMPLAKGIRIMAGHIALRDKILKPLLANFGYLKQGPKSAMSRLEKRYQRIQREFRGLLAELRIMPYPNLGEAPEAEREHGGRLHHALRSLRPPRLIPRHT
ncbi:MAG: hypothetical protein QNK37_37955 [Acidobacteriota bacterium]|nr:hypothetical protein [Acidobacteriota bacterium]